MSGRVVVIFIITVLVGSCATQSIQLPGNTKADQVLQRDAARFVMLLESAEESRCVQRKIVNTEVEEHPNDSDKDAWIERWTVDRCGSLVYYKVKFTPSPTAGTGVSVTVWE
ncbi:hypothetical protein [Kaarinaea lacus]